MLKRTVTFTNYDGEEVTQDFYFNLTNAEIVEMELSTPGGLSTMLQRIVNTKNIPETVKLFKEIMLKAYGQKSADGNHFIKNQQLTDEFVSSPAFSELYMELAFDSDAATKFINGVIPADAASKIQERAKASNGVIPFTGDNK